MVMICRGRRGGSDRILVSGSVYLLSGQARDDSMHRFGSDSKESRQRHKNIVSIAREAGTSRTRQCYTITPPKFELSKRMFPVCSCVSAVGIK